jgi:hypothetical protein
MRGSKSVQGSRELTRQTLNFISSMLKPMGIVGLLVLTSHESIGTLDEPVASAQSQSLQDAWRASTLEYCVLLDGSSLQWCHFWFDNGLFVFPPLSQNVHSLD